MKTSKKRTKVRNEDAMQPVPESTRRIYDYEMMPRPLKPPRPREARG